MPADDYDVRALALPLEDEETGETPVWSRRSTSSFRRTPSHHGQQSMRQRIMTSYDKASRRVMEQYNKLTVLQKVLLLLATILLVVFGILFLIYNERIFGKLVPVAKKWRDIRAGWLILWALIFAVSFPPLVGHGTLMTIAGFVYGFPNGWYIAASATILGSTASFIASRSLLKSFVDRLIKGDKRFAALALTLKHDGLKLLVMIRLCPLPYSLSNGAIATFPTVHWASYGLATAIISPKLMLHIFIGSQLEKIAESGGKMDPKTKAISYLSIGIGAIAGIVTGWFMYKKTRERAAQLEAEERAGIRRASIEDLEREYSDDPEALGVAETLREEEDDISLNTTWDDEYHDEPVVTEDDAIEIGDDPFKDGDGDASEDEERGKK
ncbi:golgi apparatus membrane protein TVP38 [Parastagonospora nodorum]|nr:golgi apparatus membrane protein TVP38 [Parastagonospora nodorum]KAH4076382.1 golgi apparatus membrane protein TVP38 [Parastagonospora nodorum]KAH4096139.1 golgi apparatus membrane protein TVP38 [Parastagonospora nodorum]KAH4110161.1 golgi apparatus membrane protein TVP38 [Parastagonospora nodorum]KAH4260879.1 golgi apparatus membrane protein TVP38 [Parastagonospora nodorum]